MGMRIPLVKKNHIMKFVKIYEQTETFITGCSTYKRHSIICHEKSDGHIM
jgi:hypothetical protein